MQNPNIPNSQIMDDEIDLLELWTIIFRGKYLINSNTTTSPLGKDNNSTHRMHHLDYPAGGNNVGMLSRSLLQRVYHGEGNIKVCV